MAAKNLELVKVVSMTSVIIFIFNSDLIQTLQLSSSSAVYDKKDKLLKCMFLLTWKNPESLFKATELAAEPRFFYQNSMRVYYF